MKRISFLFPQGKPKVLTMSYDDGVIYDRQLIEIFNRYGIKGTFHLNSGLMDSERKIPASEVAEVYKDHEIACHWVTHPFPNAVPATVALQEVLLDRIALEKIARYPVRGMSYPYGDYDHYTLEMLKTAGIVYSRTTKPIGGFKLPDNFLEWHPTCHHNDHLMDYAEKFLQDRHSFRSLYVWGHAYEFPRDNNWDLIEKFCAMMAGQDNIWYATNIEICDYVTALRRLEFSADCSIVHNPTALELWLSVDYEPAVIAPGETKILN